MLSADSNDVVVDMVVVVIVMVLVVVVEVVLLSVMLVSCNVVAVVSMLPSVEILKLFANSTTSGRHGPSGEIGRAHV